MPLVSNGSRRTTLGAAVAALLGWAGAIAAVSAAPTGGAVRLAVEGVGSGTFAEARLATNPGASEERPNSLCLTLAGGSPDNPDALLEWMKSNHAAGALAKRPDATVTVMQDQSGLEKGVYRLTDITVRQFRLKSDRDLSDPRLEGAEVNCERVRMTMDPSPTG